MITRRNMLKSLALLAAGTPFVHANIELPTVAPKPTPTPQPKREPFRFVTGLDQVNFFCGGGLTAGSITVVMGKAGVGKTHFAQEMVAPLLVTQQLTDPNWLGLDYYLVSRVGILHSDCEALKRANILCKNSNLRRFHGALYGPHARFVWRFVWLLRDVLERNTKQGFDACAVITACSTRDSELAFANWHRSQPVTIPETRIPTLDPAADTIFHLSNSKYTRPSGLVAVNINRNRQGYEGFFTWRPPSESHLQRNVVPGVGPLPLSR
jgi:hypothetical protein